MYMLTVGRLVLRRWITFVAGLAGTVALCFAVTHAVHPSYEASSQMMLILPPEATGAETPTNPYLNLPDGLKTTAGLVAGNLSTLDAQRALAAQGDTASYTIAVIQDAGPLLQITTHDQDPAVALATRDGVMDAVDHQLTQLQAAAAVPPEQLMHGARSSVSKEAARSAGRVYKAVVAAGALGLLYTLGMCLLVDRLLRRRARGGRTSTDDDTHPASVAEAAVVPEPDPAPDREPVPEPEPEPVPEVEPTRSQAPASRPPRKRRPRPVVVVEDEHSSLAG